MGLREIALQPLRPSDLREQFQPQRIALRDLCKGLPESGFGQVWAGIIP